MGEHFASNVANAILAIIVCTRKNGVALVMHVVTALCKANKEVVHAWVQIQYI